jgi:hypothetical protein
MAAEVDSVEGVRRQISERSGDQTRLLLTLTAAVDGCGQQLRVSVDGCGRRLQSTMAAAAEGMRRQRSKAMAVGNGGSG